MYFCLNSGTLYGARSGSATAEFLRIIPNPKAAALGENVSSLTGSPSLIINNPAAITEIYQSKLDIHYLSWVEGITLSFIGFAVPTLMGNIGGGIIYQSYGDIKYYKNNAERYSLLPSYNTCLMMSYSRSFVKPLPVEKKICSVGINLKFIHSRLAEYSTQAAAIDVGGIIDLEGLFYLRNVIPPSFIRGWRVAIVYKNFGSNMKFVRKFNPLPSSLTIGLSYKNPLWRNFFATIDIERSFYGRDSYSLGVSFTPTYFLTLYCGWKGIPGSLINGLRAGIGLDFGDFSLRYAIAPFKDFSYVHRMGIEISLGGIINPEISSDYYLRLHLSRAIESYYRKDYIQAYNIVEDILSLYPDCKDAKKLHARLTAKIQERKEKNAGEILKYLRKGDAAVSRGDLALAKRYYTYVLKIDPENIPANEGIEKVNTLLKEVRTRKLRKEKIRKIVELWKEAKKLYDAGELMRSKEKFEEILAIDPTHAPSQRYITEINTHLSKISAQKINELYSTASEYYKKGNYREALKYFEAILITAPHRLDVKSFIDDCKKRIQMEEERIQAEKLAQQQQAVEKEMESVYQSAVSCYKKGDYVGALKLFDDAIEMARKFKFEKYEKDAKHFKSLILSHLSNECYKKGFKLYQQNKLEEAIKEYNKALKYNPENEAAKIAIKNISKTLADKYYEEGMKYYHSGDIDKAKESFKKSLYYNPDKTESQRALERLK